MLLEPVPIILLQPAKPIALHGFPPANGTEKDAKTDKPVILTSLSLPQMLIGLLFAHHLLHRQTLL